MAEVLRDLSQRYGFGQSPKGLNERSTDGGYEFLAGRLDNIAIEKFTIYSDGIVVDTRSNTHDSEKVGGDILEYARSILGSKVSVERKHLVSQLIFKSEMQFGKLSPVLTQISSEIATTLKFNLRQDFVVEPTGVVVNFDVSQVKVAPAKFVIERRAESPFFEKTYFSSAPLSTSQHIELITKFEESLI